MQVLQNVQAMGSRSAQVIQDACAVQASQVIETHSRDFAPLVALRRRHGQVVFVGDVDVPVELKDVLQEAESILFLERPLVFAVRSTIFPVARQR